MSPKFHQEICLAVSRVGNARGESVHRSDVVITGDRQALAFGA